METKTSFAISARIPSGQYACLVVCDANSTRFHVDYYRKECGYTVKVEKMEFCAVCNGTNKIPFTRGKKKILYKYKPCANCKGVKIENVDVTDNYPVLDTISEDVKL